MLGEVEGGGGGGWRGWRVEEGWRVEGVEGGGGVVVDTEGQ